MPRFLDTWTGKFVWIDDPGSVVYAILSHTWRSLDDGGEQSYTDVRKLQDEMEDRSGSHIGTQAAALNLSTIFHHPRLCNKIQEACRVAREAGYRLIWIDSCCIDKSSSAELSEAINSMYEWYRLSDICYAVLEDFPDGEDPADKSSRFWACKWMGRGWTLQELIAPERVEFLTKTWKPLGSKLELAPLLEEVTRVDLKILTGQAAVDSVSVAQRMSWAARRETTRIEDQAYCLLGLFGVHMPTIYGEGRNAFIRLQEEIIKTIPDQSIFAWGSPGVITLSRDDDDNSHTKIELDNTSPHTYPPGLLAESPRDFVHPATEIVDTLDGVRTNALLEGTDPFPQRPYALSDVIPILQQGYDVVPISPVQFEKRVGKPPTSLHCVFTPQGVRLKLFWINIASIPHDLLSFPFLTCPSCTEDHRYFDALALLQCEDVHGRLIVLPLCRPMTGAPGQEGRTIGIALQSPQECLSCETPRGPPLYSSSNVSHSLRLVPEVLDALLPYLEPEAIEFHLLRYYTDPPKPKSRHRVFSVYRDPWDEPANDIQLAPRCAERLTAKGFMLSPLKIERQDGNPEESNITITTSLTSTRLRARGQQIIQLKLEFNTRKGFITSTTCTRALKNYIAPPVDTDTESPLLEVPPNPAFDGPLGAPWECVDDEDDRTVLDRYVRVFASTDFVVRAIDDSDDQVSCKRARVLRVAVEQPVRYGKHHTQNMGVLWLSFELSGTYRTGGRSEWGPTPIVPRAIVRTVLDDVDTIFATIAEKTGQRHEMKALPPKTAAFFAQMGEITDTKLGLFPPSSNGGDLTADEMDRQIAVLQRRRKLRREWETKEGDSPVSEDVHDAKKTDRNILKLKQLAALKRELETSKGKQASAPLTVDDMARMVEKLEAITHGGETKATSEGVTDKGLAYLKRLVSERREIEAAEARGDFPESLRFNMPAMQSTSKGGPAAQDSDIAILQQYEAQERAMAATFEPGSLKDLSADDMDMRIVMLEELYMRQRAAEGKGDTPIPEQVAASISLLKKMAGWVRESEMKKAGWSPSKANDGSDGVLPRSAKARGKMPEYMDPGPSFLPDMVARNLPATSPPRRAFIVPCNDTARVGDDTATAARQQIEELRRDNPEFTESELEELYAVLCTKADTPRASSPCSELPLFSNVVESCGPSLSPIAEVPGDTMTLLPDQTTPIVPTNHDGEGKPDADAGRLGTASSSRQRGKTRESAVSASSSVAPLHTFSQSMDIDPDDADGMLAMALQLQEVQREREDNAESSSSGAAIAGPSSRPLRPSGSPDARHLRVDSDTMFAMSLQLREVQEVQRERPDLLKTALSGASQASPVAHAIDFEVDADRMFAMSLQMEELQQAKPDLTDSEKAVLSAAILAKNAPRG